MYAIRIGQELFKVSGTILDNGWLEWRDWKNRGDQGVAQPENFCEWSDRLAIFPNCTDGGS